MEKINIPESMSSDAETVLFVRKVEIFPDSVMRKDNMKGPPVCKTWI